MCLLVRTHAFFLLGEGLAAFTILSSGYDRLVKENM